MHTETYTFPVNHVRPSFPHPRLKAICIFLYILNLHSLILYCITDQILKMRLFLNVAAVLLATPLVVLAAKQTASSTCETYTLKCSTSKTAWAGKTTSVEATLYNKAKGSTEDVEIGLYWNTDDFSYDKSKFSPKGYTAQTDDDSEVYYEGVAMKKSVKIQTALNVDKCAATTATVGAWASIGDCDLDIDCPVVS